MKLKTCQKCQQSLTLEMFTSTQARFCEPCKKLRFYEQKSASRQRQIERLKQQKNKIKSKKVSTKLSDARNSTQKIVNKFIRTRDEGLSCISCTKPFDDAGHYASVGSSSLLRYHPDNIHGQCRGCNHWKSGNTLEYRIGLVQKIGEKKVKWLEQVRNDRCKYTREQLEEIKKACKLGNYNSKIWLSIIENN